MHRMFAGVAGDEGKLHHMLRGRWHGGGKRGPFGFQDDGNEHRMRRGDVKFLVLEALQERPMHGYDLMQHIEDRYKGRYRPSPGSIYPTLQMLEDGGFVTAETVEGKRVFSIAEPGRKLLEERGKTVGGDEPASEANEWQTIRESAMKFGDAMRQGFRHGDPETVKRIRKIVDEARREIYKVLASDD